MRLWLPCLVLICATLRIVCSARDEAKVEVIHFISRENIDSTDVVRVCYADINSLWSTTDKVTLHIGLLNEDGSNGISEKPWPLHADQPSPDDNCHIFVGDLAEYLEKNIIFILDGKLNGRPIVYGEAEFTIPSQLVDAGEVTSQIVGARTSPATEDSLRISATGDLTGWEVCRDNVGIDVTCADNTLCYAIDAVTVGEEATIKYSLCSMATDGVVTTLRTAVLDPQPTTILDTTKLDGGVLLTYDTPAKLTVTSTAITDLEYVVTYKVPNLPAGTKKAYQVCKASATPCDLKDYVKRKETMSIVIVNAPALTSNSIQLEDYKIEGAHLGETIYELYWEKADKDFYGATIASADDLGNTLETVLTDCSNEETPSPTYCYAYFIRLDKTKAYLATVSPDKDSNDQFDPIITNQIRPETIEASSSVSPTRIMGVTMKQDSSYINGVSRVCYKASESNNSNTRHEAIIIDEDGHWIKMYDAKQEGLVDCFSPVNLLTTSLRITKDAKLTVVIVERELTGYKVFATGQADVDLSALKVSKSEVDGSSEGYTGTLAIVGAAIGGVACLMALVAVAVLFVLKKKRNNDGLQYPLHRSDIEGSNIIHGLDNLNSTN